MQKLKRYIKKGKCHKQQCSYFTHYLRYGPPVMPHTTYHKVEAECSHWQGLALKCVSEVPRNVEQMCERLEKEIRV